MNLHQQIYSKYINLSQSDELKILIRFCLDNKTCHLSRVNNNINHLLRPITTMVNV